MSDEPHSPQRPRRASRSERLVVAALVVLCVHMALLLLLGETMFSDPFDNWFDDWVRSLGDTTTKLVFRLIWYVPTGAALLLLVLSLFVRSRRR